MWHASKRACGADRRWSVDATTHYTNIASREQPTPSPQQSHQKSSSTQHRKQQWLTHNSSFWSHLPPKTLCPQWNSTQTINNQSKSNAMKTKPTPLWSSLPHRKSPSKSNSIKKTAHQVATLAASLVPHTKISQPTSSSTKKQPIKLSLAASLVLHRPINIQHNEKKKKSSCRPRCLIGLAQTNTPTKTQLNKKPANHNVVLAASLVSPSSSPPRCRIELLRDPGVARKTRNTRSATKSALPVHPEHP